MATQYLPFATPAAAQSQSQNDWAVQILKHPTLDSAITKDFWAVMTCPNSGTAYGIIEDGTMAIMVAQFTAARLAAVQGALLPASDPNVQACLAAQPKPPAPPP